MEQNPIRVIDSGSGGLTILTSLRKLMPGESYVYVGDHAHIPYGKKSTQYIRNRVIKIISYLISRKVKLIVIACNTATVAGIDYFRTHFPDIPIIGVVPVVKTAASVSKTCRFIVLSTQFTATSPYERQLITKFASHCHVRSETSSRLVPLIESGKLESRNVNTELRRMLKRFHEDNYDTIVLGCTHYPFVKPVIHAIVGKKAIILDSGPAVARQVWRILKNRNDESHGTYSYTEYITTGNAEKVAETFRILLSSNVIVKHVDI